MTAKMIKLLMISLIASAITAHATLIELTPGGFEVKRDASVFSIPSTMESASVRLV
jgi:hypothetical protein